MDENLNFITFNVNGLGQKQKRQSVFRRLLKYKSVILLQETHSTSDVEKQWRDEWGGIIEFSHGTSNSKGIAILFPPGLDFTITSIDRDDDGRILILKVSIERKEFTIVNVYAPVQSQPKQQLEFINILKQKIEALNCETCLFGGDFNFYISPELDKLDSMSISNNNESYRQEIIQMLDTLDMVDAYRILYPHTRRYTWHARGLSSRLDYWFISEELLNITKNVDIKPGVFSDHSMVVLEIGNNNTEPGKGFWKFNSSLLNDKEYVHQIKAVIAQYDDHYDYLENKCLKWELIKSEIRSFTVPYCVKKKKEKNDYKKNLEERLEQLLPELDKNDENKKHEFYVTKAELESIEKNECMGVILRSKCKYVEYGEKNTSFFLGLEKRNFSNKTITQIKVGPSTITGKNNILQAQHDFYKDLYNEKLNDNNQHYNDAFEFMTKDIQYPTVSDEDREILDGSFTEKEILNSVKSLKRSKSPGSDGLTSEFYQFFWIDIKNILANCIHYAFKTGELSIEQKRGILTLIPKKDKDRLFLKNWRPITLLNTDYKIIATVLANRLKKVLPYVIDEDQTGYIKGRFIGQNIRIIEDVLYFTKNQKLPGIILTIDFEKAFDSINWKFIQKSLHLFNFGPQFCKWVSIMYTNITSTVINNGNICQWFYPSRGIRQGCPLSAYLYIIAAELLACKIRQDHSICGIKIGDRYIKISQLADDTTCILDGLKSLKNLLHTFKVFSICSGLKINVNKTNAKYIGTLEGADYFPHGLSWIKDNVTTLGITFTTCENDNYMLNFKPRIICLENTLRIWRQRNLSLKGKITVINTLALSPLIYVASVINTPKRVIDEVDLIITRFFWNSDWPKIAKNVIIQTIRDGGLKFPDFESKVKALKLSWVQRFMTQSDGNWKLIPKFYYKCTDTCVFFCSKRNAIDYNNIPEFYKSCFNLWSKLHAIQPNSREMVINEVLWNNKYITIDNKSYIFENWQKSGIVRIADILKNDGSFMSHTEIETTYHVKTNFLQVLQIRHSIPLHWRNMLSCNVTDEQPLSVINKVQVIDKMVNIDKLRCNVFYWIFVSQKQKEPHCKMKWTEFFPLFQKAEIGVWPRIFENPFIITRETKLQSFQYRLIHRIIPCNKYLFNITVKHTSTCSFCENEDNLLHYFLYCQNTDLFWKCFFNWWHGITGINICETMDEHILFGYPGTSDVEKILNYCVLLAKWFIYCKKLNGKNNLDLYEYLIMLKERLQIEKMICLKNNQSFDLWNSIYEQL